MSEKEDPCFACDEGHRVICRPCVRKIRKESEADGAMLMREAAAGLVEQVVGDPRHVAYDLASAIRALPWPPSGLA